MNAVNDVNDDADAADDPLLQMVREVCLSLPDTKETLTWGKPHFRVGEKIFAGYGEEGGKAVVGFKLTMEDQAVAIQDDRFWRAPYVGHKGWVSMDATRIRNRAELQGMILESYRLIAPKRSLAKLEGGAGQAAARGSAPVAKKATGTTQAAARKAPTAAVKKPAKKPAAEKVAATKVTKATKATKPAKASKPNQAKKAAKGKKAK